MQHHETFISLFTLSLAYWHMPLTVADAWLVSSTLHVLDGTPGLPLMEALGWSHLPRTSVLCAQLMQLGALHRCAPRLSQPPATGGPADAGTAGSVVPSAAAAASTDLLEADDSEREGAGSSYYSSTDPSETSATGAVGSSPPAHPTASHQPTQQQQPPKPQVAPEVLAAAMHALYGALSEAIEQGGTGRGPGGQVQTGGGQTGGWGAEADLVAMSFEQQDAPCIW